MKQNLFAVLTQIIEIAWRRRRMLLIPALALLPLSIVVSRMIPQTYISKALLALQESGTDNPLGQPQPGDLTERTIRDRAPGLQALVKSDRVLVSALRDVLGDQMPDTPRKIAMAVSGLDKQLTLDMVGNNFLELQLRGSDPHGLGRQLEAITSRFLESLVSPDQDAISATQLVLERHREAVSTAEKALLLFKGQLGERALAAIISSDQQVKSQQSSLQSMASSIAGNEQEIATLNAALGTAAAIENAGHRDAEIRAATVLAEAAESKHTPAALAEAQSARTRVAQLTQLEALEERQAQARLDLEQATSNIAAQTRATSDIRSPAGQLRRLQQQVDDARATFETYSQRFPAAMSNRSLQVLNAPERIRVIDAPKDPEFPATSRLKFVVAIVLGGMALALGSVAVAEMLDQRLRHPADFEAAAGAPVIARLPPALPDPASADELPSTPPEMPDTQRLDDTPPTVYTRQSAA